MYFWYPGTQYTRVVFHWLCFFDIAWSENFGEEEPRLAYALCRRDLGEAPFHGTEYLEVTIQLI